MKLYATVTSERDSRMVKKGADELLKIELTAKNKKVGQVELRQIGANGWVFEVWGIGGEGLTFRADNLGEDLHCLLHNAWNCVYCRPNWGKGAK